MPPYRASSMLQVYLIEVNNCPALYRHGQILTDLLPLVIEEVAQKVLNLFVSSPTDANSSCVGTCKITD